MLALNSGTLCFYYSDIVRAEDVVLSEHGGVPGLCGLPGGGGGVGPQLWSPDTVWPLCLARLVCLAGRPPGQPHGLHLPHRQHDCTKGGFEKKVRSKNMSLFQTIFFCFLASSWSEMCKYVKIFFSKPPPKGKFAETQLQPQAAVSLAGSLRCPQQCPHSSW